ncbi:hypothetical protein [Nocardia sp. NPDC057440]|uniref:hypothetical protein n=1 Tax=Nocardia sp. NPDC057440 TaxID=3346134 RepID=UPI00366CF1B6
MSKFVLLDTVTEINGVDLSDHINSVEVALKMADLDSTNFSGGGKEHTPGLRDDEIAVNFQQDFAVGEVNATLAPLFFDRTEFTVTVKPRNASISATNPGFQATCVLLEYTPLSGKVGDLSEIKVKFATQHTGVTMLTS